MSGKPILHILREVRDAWNKESNPNDKYLPPGLVYYIKEIILEPNEDEDTLEANLAGRRSLKSSPNFGIDTYLSFCRSFFSNYWKFFITVSSDFIFEIRLKGNSKYAKI